MNNLFVRIVATAAWLVLSNKSNKSAICFWLHDLFQEFILAMNRYANTDLPADSIAEREERGTIVKFLNNASKQMVIDLDNTVTSQYQMILNELDFIRSGK